MKKKILAIIYSLVLGAICFTAPMSVSAESINISTIPPLECKIKYGKGITYEAIQLFLSKVFTDENILLFKGIFIGLGLFLLVIGLSKLIRASKASLEYNRNPECLKEMAQYLESENIPYIWCIFLPNSKYIDKHPEKYIAFYMQLFEMCRTKRARITDKAIYIKQRANSLRSAELQDLEEAFIGILLSKFESTEVEDEIEITYIQLQSKLCESAFNVRFVEELRAWTHSYNLKLRGLPEFQRLQDEGKLAQVIGAYKKWLAYVRYSDLVTDTYACMLSLRNQGVLSVYDVLQLFYAYNSKIYTEDGVKVNSDILGFCQFMNMSNKMSVAQSIQVIDYNEIKYARRYKQ